MIQASFLLCTSFNQKLYTFNNPCIYVLLSSLQNILNRPFESLSDQDQVMVIRRHILHERKMTKKNNNYLLIFTRIFRMISNSIVHIQLQKFSQLLELKLGFIQIGFDFAFMEVDQLYFLWISNTNGKVYFWNIVIQKYVPMSFLFFSRSFTFLYQINTE